MYRSITAALLWILLALVPLASYADGCRPGEQAWLSSGQEGYIEAVFPDGRVSIRVSNNSYTFPRSMIATRGCSQGLCSGSQVVTSAGQQGSVNGVFPDGNFSVKINGNNYSLPYSMLGSSNPNFSPDLRLGEQIWTSAGQEGRIIAAYPDGNFSVSINGNNYKLPRSMLAKCGCVRGLCTGMNVVTTAGQRGQVLGVFQDESLVVRINNNNYKLPFSMLGRTW